jgi:hypothetical protein
MMKVVSVLILKMIQEISEYSAGGNRPAVPASGIITIYYKPMIYYPISVLMNAGTWDILIISNPQDTPRFQDLLSDGHQFGVNLTCAVQLSPDDLAQAFVIGEEFIGNDTIVGYGNDICCNWWYWIYLKVIVLSIRLENTRRI